MKLLMELKKEQTEQYKESTSQLLQNGEGVYYVQRKYKGETEWDLYPIGFHELKAATDSLVFGKPITR